MEYEKEILTRLVEHYRGSKKDAGNNKINRRTQIKPKNLYGKYEANDGDFDEISKLNQAAEELSQKGFITKKEETTGTQLKCIYLVDERIDDIERYLADQYGYVPKDRKLAKMRELIDRYQDASPICKKECAILAGRVECRKDLGNIEELDNVLKAIAFIEKNQEDLYIREASMKIYGDSKFFENETLRQVCSILQKYSGRNTDGELSDEILLDYHIAKEPQKLCIKGNVIINISGKDVDVGGFQEGIEFLASNLAHIQSVKLMVPVFMTIENRTAYHRYHAADTVTFYLGGYANRYQRDFLKLVYASNKDAVYQHFGDIDAGGFWIHHNLCEVTGINFGLFGMSVDELKNSAYAMCRHPLSDHDRSRLQELKMMDAYAEVVHYMLVQNVKLEQEIVSLDLMEKSVGTV